MSNMRSASSITSISTDFRLSAFWLYRSSRRPGQATAISRPGPQAFDLRHGADAAVDGQAAEAALLAQLLEGGMGLFSQLTRGREHEHAQFAARTVLQPLQDGQRKGCCLAGAGLGQAQQVATLKEGCNCLALDGCGGGITRSGNSRLDLRGKIKLFETHF